VSVRPRSSYFFGISLLMLGLSLIAFSDNLFTDVGQASNRDPKFVVHGLFGLAWYVLLVVQTGLVRQDRWRQHQRLGVAGFGVALGLALSTLVIFAVVWKGWAAMPLTVRANRVFLLGFLAFLLLAWQRRRQPDWHKRLIIGATFFMLGPVLSRSFDPLVISWLEPLLNALHASPELMRTVDRLGFELYLFGVWTGFFLSLLVHDASTLRRLHPASLAGLTVFGATWLVCALG
jgi:hypothetical protein